MKRFLLYLSALFLSVSFATAQTTYEISTSTGELVGTESKKSAWVANDCPAGLKITATDANGKAVNTISVLNSCYKFYAMGVYPETENLSSSPTTYTISVEDGYLITGYSMTYYPSSGKKVTLSNEYGYNETPTSSSIDYYMTTTGLSAKSTTFTVSASNANYAACGIEFTVTFQEVGGEAPAEEYTVSVIAGEGGTATVNGAAEATTTGKATLVAVPNYGYKFVNWTVGTEEVSTAAEYTATVNGDTEFVANFAKFENTDEWYAAIEKPTFGKTGNTTFIKSATVDGVAVENIPEYIADDKAEGVARQSGVTTAIEVAPGAQFNLNITYQLNWRDLAIYQIDNDGATKEYGYYYGSWEPNGSTEKVAQNIADGGVSVTEVVDGACTATFPITINENHNPGDVIVVRAITGVKNDETNSAYEQGISEGGYVDFLFVVAEEEEPAFPHTLTVTEDGWATLFLGFNAEIPEGVEAYIVKEEGINDTYISLTQVEGVLPSNTGVIIKAHAGDYNFFYEETATANVDGNLLEGSLFNKNIEEEAYVLGNVDGVVGLYKAEMAGGVWLNNANKAYLPASAVPNKSAAFYGFDWNGTTGISEVKGESGNVKVVFDLTGRRVENITAPGIYVVGGKKVLVK